MSHKTALRILKTIAFSCLIFGLSLARPSAAESSEISRPADGEQVSSSQIQGDELNVFVLLASDDWSQYEGIQRSIATSGGRVVHRFPSQALIASVPVEARSFLQETPGVALVTSEPVDLTVIVPYGPDAVRYAEVWNSLITPSAAENDIAALGHPDEQNDAFIAPDLPAIEGMASASSVTPGYYQTSEYMAGSVAVGIILVESDGSVDPSTENWTAQEKQVVFNEIVAGLNWWAELEPRANLSFVYDDHFSNPLPTGVEPITRPYYQQQYWIGDALGELGYNAFSYFSRVRDYNNDLRATYQTDWAFTIFVVDSSADSDNRFSDGYFAYAYLGGPFMVMTYGNNGYGPHNMDAVAAHEMGHIFHALDQYYSAYQPCTRSSGYLHVENQNSQYGSCTSSMTSIMRGQVYPYIAEAIDPHAAGQIGWRDSDNDNIFDPLDTDLPISIDTLTQNGEAVTVSGMAQIIPYPSPIRTDATINKLTGVRYRIDGGSWQQAAAGDGTFDGTSESYAFTATVPPSPGRHTLEVAATDTAGNSSESYASETITVLDPVDGGLNTELDSAGVHMTSQSLTISGVAYHMTNGTVAGVEVRIDGGSWQPATAEDGAFDSDYEPFHISVNVPNNQAHVVEASAIDSNGYKEVNMARQEIHLSTTFLPLINHNF